jgi:hypothetical protein
MALSYSENQPVPVVGFFGMASVFTEKGEENILILFLLPEVRKSVIKSFNIFMM